MSDTALAERAAQIISPIYGEIVPIAAIQQNITRVQAAKAAVMKEHTHYGTIPGTPKPSLFKPGAEIINLMFGVSVDPTQKDDEEAVDEVGVRFYRCSIRMAFKTRLGIFLGASYGYASSLEEKYKWRRATGKREFDATPDGRRRTKFRKGNNGTEYEEQQVRTEVEDIKNTIVQMAMKRAEVSGTRRVHALSDMFGQDLEDMPAEIIESIVDGEVIENSDRKPVQAAQRKSEQRQEATAAAAAKGNQPAAGPAAGPAAESSSATGKPTGDSPWIGKIKAVDEKEGPKGPYWFVTLTAGAKCATWSSTIADQARKHLAAGDTVDLVTEAAKDPKYARRLQEIRIVSSGKGA
jgi:hypothetical protein